ncbi:MAG: 50S ribosomal protein L5 [Planctomycetes bacterium]|nr:50S ribosomal protein L5 [Planctomycetota bacterium]
MAKAKKSKADGEAAAAVATEPAPPPRLREKYLREVQPALKELFAIKNDLAVPRLTKIVVNMGVGQARDNKTLLESAAADLSTIAGQKAKVTLARKSVSGFRLREGMPIGCMVTLHGKRMYEFLDRLISVAIPRIKDFRGLPRRSFDGSGNYSLGLTEQTVFPEIQVDKVQAMQGMDVTICTSAREDAKAEALLSALGMPFRQK